MAETRQPYNSKRPRRIAMILQRLHPRQQCSSAVVTRKYRMSAAFEPGDPRGDSPDGQGTSGLRPGYPVDRLKPCRPPATPASPRMSRARKSVVQGTGGTVRVVLGGRRYINK